MPRIPRNLGIPRIPRIPRLPWNLRIPRNPRNPVNLRIPRIFRNPRIPRNPKDERRETKKTTIGRFMLDGKKVYKSTLVCPFGILMG